MQLGIDAGATRVKWSLAHHGNILARGDAPALTGHLFSKTQQGNATERLQHLHASVHQAWPDVNLSSVLAGITGLDAGEPSALTLRTLLSRTFALPEQAVQVHSDLHLTYLAYYEPGAGALLYAGTGSIAYLLDSQGKAHRTGGYGYLLGDEGGAWWLARESLKCLLRIKDDGQPPPPVLTAKLQSSLGPLDWPTLRAFVYGSERSHLASLAPLVTEAAQEGDPVAQAIIANAARELARLLSNLTRLHPAQHDLTACGGALTPFVFTLLRSYLPHHQVTYGQRCVSDANALRLTPASAEGHAEKRVLRPSQ
ncbi:putative N-acetylglucosamine kinase (plasmid) [Deinococcus peraridilitoris DSM 19664]|uniref:Putative N-acetylglucosamine kinase n=2 Tax=Deinococcus TaxID=1298 RepID=L0A6S4_DEIPD|nr:putative N-acetylglucosamine kinase [Deinococcus peraridilitoris DSM 19664]